MDKDIFIALRKEYIFKELNENEVFSDPFKQFEKWFNEALSIDGLEANAMSLATSSAKNIPSVRTVLLKNFDENGFVFYTNYLSQKGSDLAENPNASLLFYWKELERQIRIQGITEKVTRNESREYFNSRPFDSRIAALASEQSSVLKDREELMIKFNELKEKYTDSEVPLPESWGGYRLKPDRLEFWQGRMNRMHDRISFSHINGNWIMERLSP
ncbi:MAG: pyridoxamine 5'-phosphate oxidase [Ignavibacteria bacterium]